LSKETKDLSLGAARKQEIAWPLFEDAKSIYESILDAELKLCRTRDELLSLAHQLGRVLTQMKAEVGHGHWLDWLQGHWPQLGERNAQRCIALFRDNPEIESGKSAHSADFDLESLRRFMRGYIPAKERPALEGNRKLTEVAHYLTFVNNFAKFDRQVRVGLIPAPAQDLMRRECESTIRCLAEMLGRDWIKEILGL
jgi:hypothetical protein